MSTGTSQIKGRVGKGTVYVVTIDPPEPAGEVRKMVGTQVEIDGVKHLIKGVETFAVPNEMKVAEAGLLITSPVCADCGNPSPETQWDDGTPLCYGCAYGRAGWE